MLYKKHTISFKAGGLEKRRQTLMNSMKRIFERNVDTVKSPPAKEAARGATPAAMKPRMNPQRGKQKKEGDNFTPFQANEDDRPSDDDTNSNIFACGRASCKGACASPCVQCNAKHAPTKCEFNSCSDVAKETMEDNAMDMICVHASRRRTSRSSRRLSRTRTT